MKKILFAIIAFAAMQCRLGTEGMTAKEAASVETEIKPQLQKVNTIEQFPAK